LLLSIFGRGKGMEEPAVESNDSRRELRPNSGRDELNFAEFPITLLTDRVPDGLKTLVFEDQIFDQQAGEMVSRKVTITGSDAHGLPTAVDDEVLVGLIQFTKLTNDFTDPRVTFTRYELLRLLGWKDVGKNYRRIEESLNRWLGVSLYYDKAWWDKDTKEWISAKFHILDNVYLYDQSQRRRLKAKGQQELALSAIKWNEVVFKSFQADNLKRLDLDTYFTLRSAISKRMFRFLDKRFYHRRRWEFDLQEFAFEHIGLSRTYTDNGQVKAKLQPAIEELTEVGFLEAMDRERRYTKVGKGEWKILLVQKTQKVQPKTRNSAEPELEAALVSRGVTPTVAYDLIEAHAAEHIQARIEVFDWLVEKKDKRVTKSPAGYLTDSIRKGYAAPKGFETKAERERKQAAERERQRKAEETKRRADAAEKAREEADQARIRAYLDSLSPAEQEELQAVALAAANPFFLRQYRQSREPELTARYLKLIVETHVSGILAERDKQAAH
jgi:hypothetical protein